MSTSRKRYLALRGKIRKAKLKGKKYSPPIKKASSKFRKIEENNNLIISQLRAGH